MSYRQGFMEKCAEYGVSYKAVAYDTVLVKLAQEIDSLYSAQAYKYGLPANPEDITSDVIARSFDKYYGGADEVRKEFGPFASHLYDDEELRKKMYEQIAQMLRRNYSKQIADDVRGVGK